MSKQKQKSLLNTFLTGQKDYPVITAIAAGLYPVVFYYSKNFSMLNSWEHLGYFITAFLLCPAIIFTLAQRLSKLTYFKSVGKHFLPFLNIFTFLYFLKVFLYVDVERKKIVVIFILSLLFAWFLYKHLKKVIVVQFILAFIGLFSLVQVILEKAAYKDVWTQQPDDIGQVVFKKKPNVYFIEPDGYVSFSELKKPFYKVENSKFESFLEEENFKTYPDFRSNYSATLSSNGATFMMKHHYYDLDTSSEDVENAREIIMSDNIVLNAFKQNNYETYFLSETPYFLLNRPKLGYDHSNIDYSDIAYIHNGMGKTEPVLEPLASFVKDEVDKPKFFFIQLLKPWHIKSRKGSSEGKEAERNHWIEAMRKSNNLMTDIISEIKQNDPEALIMIMGDHGGYVGLDYGDQSYKKTQNRDVVYSIFSTNLTIHWPNNIVPEYDSKLKTPVNVFRILFSYLSENESYLDNLQEDASFIILNEDTPEGIYQYIDSAGNIVFKEIAIQK